MIKLKKDTSNNISFPSNMRKVMLLIDGDYYRMEIMKEVTTKDLGSGSDFGQIEMIYNLFKEDVKGPIGWVRLSLQNEGSGKSLYGYKEWASEYFTLENIKIEDKFKKHKLGTPLLSYVMNDIKKLTNFMARS